MYKKILKKKRKYMKYYNFLLLATNKEKENKKD